MNSNFDDLIDRTDSNSSRWREFGPEVLAMTTGDTDLAMPPAVREAILARCDHGVLGYDSVPDLVTEAIIERLARLYNWQVKPEWFVYIQGVVPGLNQACRALAEPGASMISENPVYYRILEAPPNMGQQLKTVEAVYDPQPTTNEKGSGGQGENRRGVDGNGAAGQDATGQDATGQGADGNGAAEKIAVEKDAAGQAGRWGFDFAGIEQIAAEAKTQLFLLCNPQNPTGRAATRAELAKLAEICLANKVAICSDEIHNEITFAGHTHTPIASLSPEVSDITITLMSPSKVFGISGLGGAFAIISNPEMRQEFKRAGKGIVSYPNALAIAAMEAAYTRCDDWLADMMALMADNRLAAAQALAQFPGLKLTLPEATYFMWLDMKDTGLNDPSAALLEAGVALSNGAKFGSPGYLRLNFATPKARLAEVLARIGGVGDMLRAKQA